jgi:hypothetical protein
MVLLAGGSGPHTLLSIAGFELLPYFSTEEACTLRLVCREFVGAIADVRWKDTETRINRDLGKWRACFPRARAANVRGRRDLVDADFVHLAGLHTLNMSWCYLDTITNAAFAHLRGIHVLNMSHCNQDTITDSAFSHLRGIHTLLIRFCTQLTGAGLAHLTGVKVLDASGCSQAVQDAATLVLAGL